MLNLVAVLPQVDEMAQAEADERRAALAEFQAKYGVTFTRETFTLQRANERGEFVLRPDRDPLPPIGCVVKIHDYDGHTWTTEVMSVDDVAGMYTAKIK